MKPVARTNQLKIESLPDETVVVDLDRNKAHCLNKTASAVWGYCDGKTTPAEMAARLHSEFGLPARESLARNAIQQLAKANLLEAGSLGEPPLKLPTRREMSRDLSIRAALLVPLITSIAVPTAALAQSTSRPPAPRPPRPRPRPKGRR